MILFYTFLLVSLGMLRWLVSRRVALLEWRYARAALNAEAFLREPQKPGNASRFDVCQTAKRQFLLGQLVQKRDRLEAQYESWQRRAEKYGSLVASVQNWKGKKLPYTFGAVDVSGLLYVIDRFGAVEYFGVPVLIELVTHWLSN